MGNSVLEEKGFIIDLSNTVTSEQLVSELGSILELPEIKNKAVCLKLGNIDLKQSQLLSIKALIESMESTIQSVVTSSNVTKLSAESLNLETSEFTAPAKIIKEEPKAEVTETQEQIKTDFLEENQLQPNTVIENEVTGQLEEISEIIPMTESSFQNLAKKEGLIDEASMKYVPLDTQDVIEDEIEEKSDSTDKMPTLYMTQTLRSGQTLNYNGNVIIIGDAHPGSEIIANGDITVWGVLGGIVHAGANGNTNAKIRALKFNAIQIRIAGLYARRNDTINVPFVQKTSEFTPEEARIDNKQIIIYKTIRRD
ncbi:hypothetical protein IJI31_06955 [bacterium]|nr:hypothetical protein [bacterium]